MYRLLIICLLLLSFTGSVLAREITLDQAVSQVKKDTGGQVISARTVKSGQSQPIHEIRVLDANGMIKTYRIPSGKKRKSTESRYQQPNMDVSHFNSNYNRNRQINQNASNNMRARSDARNRSRVTTDTRQRTQGGQEKKDKR